MPAAAAPPTSAARAIAWSGAGLFAFALGYFLYTYAVTFGETVAGPLRPAALAWDVALFSGFAVHHSVFARLPVRAFMARTVPPPIERAVYVWIASLLLIGTCAAWTPLPGMVWQLGGAAAWTVYAVQAAGILLTLQSAATIDIWDLAGIRQMREGAAPNAATPNSQTANAHTGSDLSSGVGQSHAVGSWEFRTSGPYGWVRHPIYSGWFLIMFATTPMTMTKLVFAVVSSAYVLIAIPLEERSLRSSSGGAYDEYSRAVRWKVIPGVY